MRLRRLILLVIVAVVGLAASAHADCAWVLWFSTDKVLAATPVKAGASLAECEGDRRGAIKARLASGYEPTGDPDLIRNNRMGYFTGSAASPTPLTRETQRRSEVSEAPGPGCQELFAAWATARLL